MSPGRKNHPDYMGTLIAVGALGFLYLMGFCLMAINPRDDE